MDKKKTKKKQLARFGVSMPISLLQVLDEISAKEDVTRSKMVQILVKDAKKRYNL